MRGQLEARITLDDDKTFNVLDAVGTYLVTIPAGEYYWNQPGNQAFGLLATVENALTADTPHTWQVTMPDAADPSRRGLIWVNKIESGSVTLEWLDTDFRDLLGFDQDETGSLIISDLSARALFLPDVPFRSLNGGGSWRGTVESNLAQTVTDYGQVYSLVSATRKRNQVEWRGLARDRVWDVNASPFWPSLESFWREGIAGLAPWGTPGGPVLWYPDENDLNTFAKYTIVNAGRFEPRQLRENFTGYWAYSFDMLEVPP